MKINGKKVKRISYFWFDHCFLRETGIDKHIEDAINTHNWIQFKTYQEILNNMVTEGQHNEKWEYLPNTVSVRFEDDTFERVELTREIFDKIDFTEYECG